MTLMQSQMFKEIKLASTAVANKKGKGKKEEAKSTAAEAKKI